MVLLRWRMGSVHAATATSTDARRRVDGASVCGSRIGCVRGVREVRGSARVGASGATERAGDAEQVDVAATDEAGGDRRAAVGRRGAPRGSQRDEQVDLLVGTP